MFSFLVILKDKSQQTLSSSLLAEHVQHLKKLQDNGNLVVCGPFTDDSGAVLVINAKSLDDVRQLIQADPFIRDAYYDNYSITEFYKVDKTNNYLMEHEQTIGELNRQKTCS